MRLIILICTLLLTACATEQTPIARSEDAVIIDVRSPQEFQQGHIPGAILLPLDRLQYEILYLVPAYDQIIYVYCRAGRRSALAAAILQDMGYTAVYDLGGVVDWPGELVVTGV